MTIMGGGSTIDTSIMLYDSEIKDITDGPLAWFNTRVGSLRNVDDVHKGLIEQFEKIGLRADVQVWTFGEKGIAVEGAYMFQVMIDGRIEKGSGFDYEKMQHEVQNNLLGIPGEGGKIKFDEAEFRRQHAEHKPHPH